MKIKSILSTIILFIVLSLTVGFSAFVSEMSISSLVAEVRLNEDVRVTGVRVVDSVNASANELDYDADSIIGNINLNAFVSTLTLEVTITNFGNTPMGIYEITGLSDNLLKIVDGYTLKDKLCDASGNCTLGSITTFNITIGYDLYDAVTKNHDIRLDFNFKEIYSITYTDISNNNYPSYIMDGQTLSVNFGSNAPSKLDVYSDGVKLSSGYSYVNGTLTVYDVSGNIEINKSIPVAKLVKGDLNTVGSEVCIGNECFYVISNDGTKVSMLAKYNLNVGYIAIQAMSGMAYNDELYNVSPLVMTSKNAYVMPLAPQDPTIEGTMNISPIENPSGIQDSTMIYDGTTYAGVEKFSSGSYWTISGRTLNAVYGENYPAYVYDETSLLYNYVENYKKYLNALDAPIINARLISYDELTKLGCKSSCTYDWIHSTLYWTGTAGSVSQVYAVGSFGIYHDAAYMRDSYNYGVRPVIEISVEDIYVPPVATVVSGDYDTVGSEVCLGNECFYVISSTDDSVTMLAKYNLLVGNSVDENWNVTPLANSTGIQDSSARGYFEIDEGVSGFPIIGTVPFSSTDTTSYEDSTIKDYVANYGLYLKSTGFNLNDVRLLTFDEIMEFSHSKNIDSTLSFGTLDSEEYIFSSAPSWLYSTSYWLGSALGDIAVYRIDTSAFLHPDMPELDDDVGVRPVITISKDYF